MKTCDSKAGFGNPRLEKKNGRFTGVLAGLPLDVFLLITKQGQISNLGLSFFFYVLQPMQPRHACVNTISEGEKE